MTNYLYRTIFGAISVKDPAFGAVGDGTTDDTNAIQAAIDSAYGSSGSPHGTANVTSNCGVFFPPGNYKIISPLNLTRVRGARIFGANRFTTKITNTTSGSKVFVTNGFEYSVVEGLELSVAGSGSICFDLDWDNSGPTALQSNTFRDVFMEGADIGLCIGRSGNMGSETLIQNCYFISHGVAGVKTCNGNALQQTMIGGNIAQCAIGIWASSGSVPSIVGVGFQGSTDTDISVDNSSGDTYSVSGCRSESVNFCRFQNGSAAHLSGCTQINASAGIFAFIEGSPSPSSGPGVLTVDSCASQNGKFTGNGDLYIRGNRTPANTFRHASYLGSFTGTVVQNI